MATLSVWGCAGNIDSELPEVDATESNLVRPAWVPCARQGQFCAFNGRHRVRYGASGRYATRFFSDGVQCDAGKFGIKRVRSATCDFDANQASTGAAGSGNSGAAGSPSVYGAAGSAPVNGAAGSAPVDHTQHMAAGTSGTVMGAAGSAPVDHTDHAAAGTGGTAAAGTGGAAGSAAMDHTAHTAAGSGGAAAPAMMGPYIDMSAIPEGEAGTSVVKITNTTEKPATSDGTGDFRTSCGFSHMLKDDPLVFPGQPGKAHLHAFFGNTDVDAYSTQDSIRNTGNSTCRGGIANRSSYWVPALIDAQGKPVKPISMDVYYKSGYNGIAPQAIQKFPSGLRVIAGSAKASAAQEHAFWECHGAYNGHPASIPQCPGAEAIKMMVEFPQCWDGKNLDSADHMSHMAYPSGGKCPSTHPVPIPAITFNVLYPVRDTTGWHLASDMYDQKMPGGFSAHADWFEGWDPKVSEAFVKNCVNPAVDCHSHLLGDG
ncbi:MAG TPA: DUF1996 domain-containing protein, partial [Polyangiales bacterium]|nr:DUF1996 domain-containing protein [Polyangiales bacterium]